MTIMFKIVHKINLNNFITKKLSVKKVDYTGATDPDVRENMREGM